MGEVQDVLTFIYHRRDICYTHKPSICMMNLQNNALSSLVSLILIIVDISWIPVFFDILDTTFLNQVHQFHIF